MQYTPTQDERIKIYKKIDSTSNHNENDSIAANLGQYDKQIT